MKCSPKLFVVFFLVSAGAIFGGCANTQSQLLEANASQVQLRSIQSRAFDTLDKDRMMRSIISCLQDLDFLIEKADYTLGTVTATKYVKNTALKMTVTLRERSANQLLIRANAQFGIRPIENPEPYQDFFNSLSKAVFLTAQQVD